MRKLRAHIHALALGAVLAATPLLPAAAKSIRVGAGEHPSYSRVVLHMPPPQQWSAKTLERGVQIRLPKAAARFQTDAITKRRQAHRVSSFRARREGADTIVTLGFNCACQARIFPLNGKMLVIDVRAAPSSHPKAAAKAAAKTDKVATGEIETAKIETAQIETKKEAPKSKSEKIDAAQQNLIKLLKRAEEDGFVRFRDDSDFGRQKQAEERAQQERAAEQARLKAEAEAKAAAEAKAKAEEEAKAKAETAAKAQQPEKRTASDASAAVAQGAKSGAAKADGDMAADKASSGAAAATAKAAPATNTQAHAQKLGPETQKMLAELHPCLPDSAFDINAWRSQRPFHEELTARRSAVFDELNRVDPEGVVKLARHYVVNGLGLEAIYVPESFGVETDETKVIAAMARVLERTPPLFGGPLGRRSPCPGRHGLWQAAALAEVDPVAAAKAYAGSGRALPRTPEPIRRILGARIGRALVAAGEDDAAKLLMKLLKRSLDPATNDMLLLDAELLLKDDRDVAARAALRRVAATRDPLSVVALVRLSELMQPPYDASRVPSLATRLRDATTEWRGEEYAVTLAAAEAKMRARFGDLVGAVDAIDRLQARLEPPSERLRVLRSALVETEIRAIAKNGDADRVASAIETVNAMALDFEGARLRLMLAEALISSATAHLVPLVVPQELRERDPLAADIIVRASAASNLSGSASRYEPGQKKDAKKSDEKIETADAPPSVDDAFEQLRRRAFAAYLGPPAGRATVINQLKASKHPEAKSLLTLLQASPETPAANPNAPIETPAALKGGKAIIMDLDAELKLMKEIAGDG